MSRRARPVIGLVTLCAIGALVTGCTAGADEPPGLSTEPGSTGSVEATSTESQTAEAEPTEPSASFTQPYLPEGEQSVIDLPTDIPAEPPAGASDAEREVVGALGRFMASWNALLFGAGVSESGIEETSSGTQLDRLRDFAAEAEEKQWVFVGDPMALEVRSVEVDGGSATVDVCVGLPQWFEYVGEVRRALPVPSPERYTVTFRSRGEDWSASETEQQDAAVC